MIRLLLPGIWVCIVTLLSSYVAVDWASQHDSPKKEEIFLEGLEYRRTPSITIPMVLDGAVDGYVTARFVFTADASILSKLPIDPTAFVTSEAFQQVYVNGQIRMNQLQKYNLKDMSEAIKINVNKRLNGDVVQDVLLDGLNYISKSDMRRPSSNPKTQARPVAKSEPSEASEPPAHGE